MKASLPEQPDWRQVLAPAEGDAPALTWLRNAVDAVQRFGEERFCAESSAWLRQIARTNPLAGPDAAGVKALLWYGAVSRCVQIQQAALDLLAAPGSSSPALAWTVAQFSPDTAAPSVVALRRELGLGDVAVIEQAHRAMDESPSSDRLQ